MAEIDFKSLEEDLAKIDFKALEEELAKIDPVELRYLSQLLRENTPKVENIIQNALNTPISEEKQKRPIAATRNIKEKEEFIRPFQNPFFLENVQDAKDYQNEVLNLYDARFDGKEKKRGRRYIQWSFMGNLNEDLTPQFMKKIRENVKTSFYMRHVYSYVLINEKDAGMLIYYINKGSPWIKKLEDAEKWLQEREAVRLDPDNINRPSTKWRFLMHFAVDLKVVLDRQPLMGTGPLPVWLRNLAHGRSMVALDAYRDNLCLWRCIAVHRGARPDRSTKVAQGLAKSFFKLRDMPTDCPKTSLDELEKVEMHLNKGTAFSDLLGIRVYEPERVGTEVVWHLKRNPAAQLKNIMTIGIFGGHAFLIKDITKLAKTYTCVHCNARFTRNNTLQRHEEKCAQGKTVIDCPGKKVEAPETAYEKAFYPKHRASKESLRWLEYVAKRWKIRVHHAMSGHGGERWIERAPVDGYNPEKKVVFQYHGCYWHGCRKCYPYDRGRIIDRGDKTREDLYIATKKRTAYLRKAGYKVIEAWACEVGEKFDELPQAQTKSYPHTILYDFEAYGDKNKRKDPTGNLTIENAHVPISVSIGDTLERDPTHICDRDPAELVRKFMEELERRGKTSEQK